VKLLEVDVDYSWHVRVNWKKRKTISLPVPTILIRESSESQHMWMWTEEISAQGLITKVTITSIVLHKGSFCFLERRGNGKKREWKMERRVKYK
jgi:hypothetical protein